MKQITKHLNDNRVGQFATVKNGQSIMRPFHFLFVKDEKFYFMTNNRKEVYKQLRANPTASFISMSNDMQFVRIRGAVEFVNDLELKKEILQKEPIIAGVYKTADNPEMELFRIHTGVARLNTGNGKIIEEVNF